ncbi:alkaline phosphatase family protein [Streptomyces sp. NPDC051569]|uniref:alkaline phosphatase family protein n=1 Tax=Streptomyces sp. NPDC051569 TaxID=3365661 RepID=UPI0037BDA5C6
MTADVGAGTGPRDAGTGLSDAVTAKVLVIGIDGVLLDRVADADAPRLTGLMAEGLTARSGLYTLPMAETMSGPGWSTLATGVWPDKHGVKDNTFVGKRFDAHPDFLTRIKDAAPALRTYAAADWEPLTSTLQNGPVFSAKIDKRLSLEGDGNGYDVEDPKIATAAAAELRDGDPDAAFVYFCEADEAGHLHGAASQQYLDAIARVDARIGQLLDALAARPAYHRENWRILVATDHGHTDAGGHGGSSDAERSTFVIATGAGIPAGSVRDDVKLVDVAATALAHLGVPTTGLDGVPLDIRHQDDFEELGRPESGFTHTPPAGWSVDNSRMGTGGAAVWHGWTFTTDAFWSRAERDQGRELNVRARGVFAVADSGRWAAEPRTAAFDSTLTGPRRPVTGGTTRYLRFRTHYRHEAGQRAEVLVSYDGSQSAVVRSYTADAVARSESIPLQVPAGATQVRVGFRYSGDDAWYWALDGVQLD